MTKEKSNPNRLDQMIDKKIVLTKNTLTDDSTEEFNRIEHN